MSRSALRNLSRKLGLAPRNAVLIAAGDGFDIHFVAADFLGQEARSVVAVIICICFRAPQTERRSEKQEGAEAR